MSKTKELAVAPSEEAIIALQNSFPVEQGFTRIQLPRLGFYSQDQVEGKGKAMKVTTVAGTFYTEEQSDEIDEDTGKKVWNKNEIGDSIEATIIYRRKQLKFFDGEKYTSSPVYDNDDEVIPLFRDKVEVDRGTPQELKAKKEYQGVNAKGKAISKLEDNRVLYVLYKEQIYQLSLRGTSMYSFMTYAKNVLVPSVVTRISSESKENGAIAWNQMVFESVRKLDSNEVNDVLARSKEISDGIKMEKDYYKNADKDFEKIGSKSN